MKMRITFVLAALVALFAAVMPAQAQVTNTVSWRAQYYNNLFLSGVTPHFETMVHNGLTLDFGTGSPDASIQGDNFSARFTADADFPAGWYRFSIRADDEFQFRVNDNVVLTTMDNGQPNNILNIDLELSGITHLQLDYRERTGGAYVSLNWLYLNANTTNVPTGTWLAEYFPNQTLSQPAAAIFNESSPSHNWGFNAPVPNMPAEYWSARWRTTQNFATGTYRFTASVDDGVRVYVDNTLIIDRFTQSPGSVYTQDVAMMAGDHVITVEYLELFNNAYLDFKIEQVHSIPGPGAWSDNATATVTAFRLNVRNVPTTNNSIVVTKVDAGQTFPIVGRTTDNSWYEIDVNGTRGWVSAAWVRVNNGDNVPATQDAPTLTIPAGSVATQNVRVNFRSGPSTTNTQVLTIVPRYTVMNVVGRTADSQWLQVQYNGLTGWVLGSLVRSDTPLDFGSIPVTG